MSYHLQNSLKQEAYFKYRDGGGGMVYYKNKIF